eukprot:353244-Chlamydomonas_euryale.AAC.12
MLGLLAQAPGRSAPLALCCEAAQPGDQLPPGPTGIPGLAEQGGHSVHWWRRWDKMRRLCLSGSSVVLWPASSVSRVEVRVDWKYAPPALKGHRYEKMPYDAPVTAVHGLKKWRFAMLVLESSRFAIWGVVTLTRCHLSRAVDVVHLVRCRPSKSWTKHVSVGVAAFARVSSRAGERINHNFKACSVI